MTSPAKDAPPSAPATGLRPGEKFGSRYTIIKLIGVGGMGAVYQAWDESLGIAVALKVIRPDASASATEVRQLEARFKRELLLARQVTHPNVVRIHDLGELGGTKYITMAYVDGRDLATAMRQDGRFSVVRALTIFRQIVAGLTAAHAVGVVHRDLKPANVILDGEDHALVTDFGIARSIEAGSVQSLPGSIVGTLDYMAPEQARGDHVDKPADVYALGLIFYEMLAGGRPGTGQERGALADLLWRVQKGPPPLETVVSDVPVAILDMVARCLDLNPAARYQSAADVQAALDQLGTDGRARLAPTSRRSRTGLVIAGVAVLIAAAAGTAWWMGRARETPTAQAARAPILILVANFDNRARDPVFDGSLEQALTIAVEGASFITSYPRRDASSLAGQLRPGSTLDTTTAQLVAVREQIDVVLAGSIAQEAGGYALQLSAFRPASAEPFATTTATAATKQNVLDAVGRVAADIRRSLGDAEPSAELRAETFSAASLEAVRAYIVAQDLSMEAKYEQAIQHYKDAVSHDPQFGRAYAGWALAAFHSGNRSEAEEIWKKALSLMDRMTEREKLRTLGVYFTAIARNYEKSVEVFQTLVNQYPGDRVAYNNLAVSYFYLRDFARARDAGKRAIELYPRSAKYHTNDALYAMYASDFRSAADSARQAITLDPQYDQAYLPLAMSGLSNGEIAAARSAYEQARKTGPAGASLAAIGLADIALYEGRSADAVSVLEAAIPRDRESRNALGEAAKLVALAEARTGIDGAAAGLRVLDKLIGTSTDESVVVPAAHLLIETKQAERAAHLSRTLEQVAQPVPRAYARIITGELALHERRYADAIEAFAAAIKATDLWLARFDLGVAYVESGRYAEAIAELETCTKRRGEATALFFDDSPTYRYAAVLPYWIARAQQGLGIAAAAATFQQFLQIKSAAGSDALVLDARRRLQTLRETQPR